MLSFEYTIKDKLGIHARPAGQLVKEAGKYSCEIILESNGKQANLKRIFSIMKMIVKHGDTIKITFDGIDEDAAYTAIKNIVESNI